MSKKTTIIGIVVLVLGAIAVPTGIFASDYIRTLVSEGIPEGLLDIQDGVIEDGEDTVATLAIPEVLLGVKAEADAALPDIVMGGTTAYMLNQTIMLVASVLTLPVALDWFFNNQSFTILTGAPYDGVTEYITGGMGPSLGYTAGAQNALMFTGTTITTSLYNRTIPGIITDTTFGFGVLYYLEAYQAAATSVPGVNASMRTGYGASWDQLTYMAGYLSTYMFTNVVLYYTGLGTSVAEVAEKMLYEQWANGTYAPGGLDLSLLSDLLTDPVIGLEAGVPTPTGIPLGMAKDMFNDTLPLAFTNDMGIMAWAYAAQGDVGNSTAILSFFTGLTPTQLGYVANWLFTVFKPNVVPPLILASEGLTMWELTNERLFLPQWANGTYFPTGLDLTGVPNKGRGWEIGVTNDLPTPSGITVASALLLFTETNALALVNDDGLERWYAAKVNDSNYVALKVANLLTDAEMLLLMDYVPRFRDDVVPYLAEYKYDLPTDAYTLADGLLYGLMIPGIALLALGGVALVISIIKRKS